MLGCKYGYACDIFAIGCTLCELFTGKAPASRFIRHFDAVYCIILYQIILHYIISYYITLYYITLHYVMLCYSVV